MSQFRRLARSVALTYCLLFAAAGLAADNQCIECHANPDYFVENPKLYKYYQLWQGSPHERSAVTCDDCHGGKPEKASMTRAHVGVSPVSDPRSTLHFRNQPKTCGQCHHKVQSQFIRSKHYAELSGQRTAPTCTTCHSAMSHRPEFHLIVLNACRNCHGEGNSENLPLITPQAENLFHQLNILEGLLGWTRIHYETVGWPDASRERMQDLDARHDEILNWVHQFDLQATEAATRELLAELREIFDEARRVFEEREQD